MPLQRLWLVGLATLLGALALVALFRLSPHQPERVTPEQIAAVVDQLLASATPAPSNQSLVYAAVAPSVVTVIAEVATRDAQKPAQGLGSGVVIDDAGIILTSLHVVEGARSITVAFADGTRSRAVVINTDAANDLAVLQAESIPDDLPAAVLAGAGGLHVGAHIMAIGAPLGLSGSLTSGIVSGLGRSFQEPNGGRMLHDMIQFDAAVNPGNSGGPLVDRNGAVVGIVTGLINATGAPLSAGIGYAVPIQAAGGAAGAPWD